MSTKAATTLSPGPAASTSHAEDAATANRRTAEFLESIQLGVTRQDRYVFHVKQRA